MISDVPVKVNWSYSVHFNFICIRVVKISCLIIASRKSTKVCNNLVPRERRDTEIDFTALTSVGTCPQILI